MAKPESKTIDSAKKKHKVSTSRSKTSKIKWSFPLSKNDMIFIGIGIGVIILGYILMATGITEEPALPEGKWNNPLAVTVAPLLLVIGYCVIIPLAILRLFRRSKDS